MRDQAFDDDSQIPSEILADLGKGLIAGFAATVALSILVIAQKSLGLVPEFDLIAFLSQLAGSASPAVGWAMHFFVGTIVWGLLFSGLDAHLQRSEGSGELMRGTFFGLLIYLVMMMFLMPLLNLGFFAVKLGVATSLLAFGDNIVYGLVLGGVYGVLRPVPVTS